MSKIRIRFVIYIESKWKYSVFMSLWWTEKFTVQVEDGHH